MITKGVNMQKEVVILIAEDDEGHAKLVIKNFKRIGIANTIIHFKNGQEALDFFYKKNQDTGFELNKAYLLILDIRMPKVDGIEVLRKIKENPEFKKIPIIMLTTTDDPQEVEKCHSYGCSNYVTKPINFDSFMQVVQHMGLFLKVVEIPRIKNGIVNN